MEPYSVLVGGWEFTKDDGIDKKISQMSNGKIVLIPHASKFADKQTEKAIEAYGKCDVEVHCLEEKAEAIPHDFRIVYLGGGDPEKLMEYFKVHPELLKDIENKWLAGEIVLCGSSTGAMVQFKEMLALDSRGKGETNLIKGLGMIKNEAFVIPHWDDKNGSEEWRQRIVQDHENKLIITIDEHTGLFWRGEEGEVIGLGNVNVYQNGKRQSYRNGDHISNLKLAI